MIHNNLWYVRRGTQLKGPFPAGLVSRYILLDRVRLGDEVSQDRETWRRVADVPALIPDVMKADPSDEETQRRLEAARRWADERRDIPPADTSGDRRQPEPDQWVQYREVSQRLHRAERPRHEHYLLQLAAILLGVGAVIALAMLYTPQSRIPESDCSAPPARGVNWSNCKLQGAQAVKRDLRDARLYSADLSGASLQGSDLSGANIAYADLSLANARDTTLVGVNLIGANLRSADLSNADLRDANLSYADLTGAKLDGANLAGVRLGNTIWVDHSVCAPQSIGRCVAVAASR